MHVWFKEVADMCYENGVCVNDIVDKVIEMQVDEHFIKSLYRRRGLRKFGKKSTRDHNPMEVTSIYEDMVKFFAEQVDPPLVLPPFPSLDNSILINEQ